MGIIKRGILGGFSNKVANVVGTSWKGRAVMKALPLSVANPRTTPQVTQRTKFGDASKLFSQVLGSWVKPLWDRFAGDISGYNAIMKRNVELFEIGTFEYFGLLDWSIGRMNPPAFTSAVADKSLGTIACALSLPIDTAWGGVGNTVFVLALNETSGAVLGVNTVTGNSNSNVSVSISSTEFEVGDEIVIVSAIRRADGTQVSNNAQTAIQAVA